MDLLELENTPGSSVTLHGQEYRLTLPVRAVLAFKKLTGIDLFRLAEDKKDEREGTENVAGLFYCMIGQHHPDVTYDQVTLLLDLGNFAKARQAVIACMASYLPPPEPKENAEQLPNVAAAQTG